MHIDGASRGNPGPAACAVVVGTAQGKSIDSFSKYLGRATNNFAEYQALLAALEYALSHRHSRVRLLTDSELIARQVSGHYKVRDPGLKPLHEKACELISRLESFAIRHVPRGQNREADRLANQALDAAEAGNSEAGRAGAAAASANPSDQRVLTHATYQQGVLKSHGQAPLRDGEEVELEIRRRK
jgi:ribonuclease HI